MRLRTRQEAWHCQINSHAPVHKKHCRRKGEKQVRNPHLRVLEKKHSLTGLEHRYKCVQSILRHWIFVALFIRIIKIACFWEAIQKGYYKYQKYACKILLEVYSSH